MQESEQLVIDTVNVRLTALHKAPEEELRESVLGFVQKYGFLGFMTALPTTADFIAYESVYLPKKHFIKEEFLSTENYLSYFYPFDKLDFRKKGVESGWSVTNREGIAIAMAMRNAPQAVMMDSPMLVGIVVTVISIIVTVISIWQSKKNKKHQKSNRPDQS